jgi:hypothetical protein
MYGVVHQLLSLLCCGSLARRHPYSSTSLLKHFEERAGGLVSRRLTPIELTVANSAAISSHRDNFAPCVPLDLALAPHAFPGFHCAFPATFCTSYQTISREPHLLNKGAIFVDSGLK